MSELKNYEIVDIATSEGRKKIEDYRREKQERVQRGQQLYAKIKRASKYYGQGRKEGLFEIAIVPSCGEYCVQGGPGGQYTLRDVNLYVCEDGKELRIA